MHRSLYVRVCACEGAVSVDLQSLFFGGSMRPILFLIPAIALLGACQTATVSTTRDRYVTAWANRLEQYKAQFIEKDKAIRAKVAQPMFYGSAQDPNPWPRFVSRVSEVCLDARDAFVIAGRGEALKAFLAHIQADPTPGLTDVWFIEQAQDIEREAHQLESRGQQFAKTFDQQVRQGPSWIAEMENLNKAQGMLSGRDAELRSLHEQALSYFLDLRQAQSQDRYQAERRARAARTLLGAGAYLNQLNYQQQLLNTLNRPRTCTANGNFVTCF